MKAHVAALKACYAGNNVGTVCRGSCPMQMQPRGDDNGVMFEASFAVGD